MTPYEKHTSLPGAGGFLKPGITFEQLDAAAHALNRPGGRPGSPASPQGAGLGAWARHPRSRDHKIRPLAPGTSCAARPSMPPDPDQDPKCTPVRLDGLEVREPAYTMLNIVIWRGDAAPPSTPASPLPGQRVGWGAARSNDPN